MSSNSQTRTLTCFDGRTVLLAVRHNKHGGNVTLMDVRTSYMFTIHQKGIMVKSNRSPVFELEVGPDTPAPENGIRRFYNPLSLDQPFLVPLYEAANTKLWWIESLFRAEWSILGAGPVALTSGPIQRFLIALGLQPVDLGSQLWLSLEA